MICDHSFFAIEFHWLARSDSDVNHNPALARAVALRTNCRRLMCRGMIFSGGMWGEEGSLVLSRAEKCTIVEFRFPLSNKTHHGSDLSVFDPKSS